MVSHFMPIFYIIILAIVQGISEFLPISSSGHLVLTHTLMDGKSVNLCWEKNRLMDVAVHVGTLLSVLIYFRSDLIGMGKKAFKIKSTDSKLLQNIIIASMPVIAAGLLLQLWQPSLLCSLKIMAWMTLIFGIILGIADRFKLDKSINNMSHNNAFIIGLSQALALIPGVSRSGITMTSARFLGFSRVDSAKFSLLLSIIAISGAGFLTSIDLFKTQNIELSFDIFLAVIFSFVFGYIAISLMMKWLSNATFKPFVIYRIILGTALLILLYSGII